MPIFLYTIGVLSLTVGLTVFSYLDRVYRELGRLTTGRIHEHLQAFESEIEPRLKMSRRRGAQVFSLLARLWLVLVAAVTARGVIFFVPSAWEAATEMVFFLGAEVIITMQFFPSLLLAGSSGDWLAPFIPVVRIFVWIIRPIQGILDLLVSVLHVSEEEPVAQMQEQQSLEDFVDAATQEGIIEQDEARMIEQVVEFSDKRVRDVMTARPDVVAIRASATLEALSALVVERKFSRIPVYEKSLDDIVGIVMAREMLGIRDRDAVHHTVRELMRPALFVPEMKFGSELLKEMQGKSQQMAIVIDEYGLMAGIVTLEDLVEEIVGEIGEEDRRPVPDVVREPGGALILRGSLSVAKIGELLGVQLDSIAQHSNASTVAGLLNGIAGHVPRTGEVIEADGLRFEVLEANQRKVLRVRARKDVASVAS